jgi:hypothetical protein
MTHISLESFFPRVADSIKAFTQTSLSLCVHGPIHDPANRSLGESTKILSKYNICNKF